MKKYTLVCEQTDCDLDELGQNIPLREVNDHGHEHAIVVDLKQLPEIVKLKPRQ